MSASASCSPPEDTSSSQPEEVHKTKRPAPTTTSPSGSTERATTTPTPSQSPVAPTDWSKVFASVSSGVVRLDVVGCDGNGGTGTGFLVDPTLVATVAHVVEGYKTIRVTSPKTGLVTAGRVVGYDHAHDLAL